MRSLLHAALGLAILVVPVLSQAEEQKAAEDAPETKTVVIGADAPASRSRTPRAS